MDVLVGMKPVVLSAIDCVKAVEAPVSLSPGGVGGVSTDGPSSCLLASDVCVPAELSRKIARKSRAPVAKRRCARIVSCNLGPKKVYLCRFRRVLMRCGSVSSYRQTEK